MIIKNFPIPPWDLMDHFVLLPNEAALMRSAITLLLFSTSVFLFSCNNTNPESEPGGSSELGFRWDSEGYESGEVSCYGVPGEGGLSGYTALGIRFRPEEIDKAACADSLLGQYIELVCPRETFRVQCVDTGGFRGRQYNRILDLYAGTFRRCFGTRCPSLGQAKYRREDELTRYCGKSYFNTEAKSDGSLAVTVDKRCPATEVEYTLLAISTNQSQAKSTTTVVKESVARRTRLNAQDGRLVATLEVASQVRPKDEFSKVRIALKNVSKTLFVTGPTVPSPDIPGQAPPMRSTEPEPREEPPTRQNAERIPEPPTTAKSPPGSLEEALREIPRFDPNK
jgi:hypothetical protein